MQITLADGSQADLANFDAQALYRLQFEQEQAFAEKIQQAPKGSRQRSEAIGSGYDTVCTILGELRGGKVQAMGFDPRYARLVVRLLRQLQAQGQATPTFFEIGYGSGALLTSIAAQGFGVSGIEVSAAVRNQALEAVPGKFHDQLYLGDFLAHDLGAAGRHFDLVYWNDVLEHIPPDEAGDFLAKIHQILRPGGCLVTITPNWHERPSDVTGDFAPPRTEARGLHLKEYTLREMVTLLHQTRFTRVETPLVVLPQGIYLGLGGLVGVKQLLEPALEWMPFRLARLLVHGFGLSYTIAYK